MLSKLLYMHSYVDSIQVGSIPFLPDKVKPPFNLSSWEGLAVEAWDDPLVKKCVEESPTFKRAYAQFEGILPAFDVARKFLVWCVAMDNVPHDFALLLS